ncbi:hypothetical protein DPEC_G00256120 [Dallia pectoralis]|uniref:Uncharacterized protein n=1 Tax=Dallia pectoralis TaxID=75939 RepID=A0ACC2FUU9_DALPE|nr:hypothetical protein DPEC_G00256120 [Dallia pectoralis]
MGLRVDDRAIIGARRGDRNEALVKGNLHNHMTRFCHCVEGGHVERYRKRPVTVDGSVQRQDYGVARGGQEKVSDLSRSGFVGREPTRHGLRWLFPL